MVDVSVCAHVGAPEVLGGFWGGTSVGFHNIPNEFKEDKILKSIPSTNSMLGRRSVVRNVQPQYVNRCDA